MPKLKKQQKYLNYKLTTLKGVSVPQGFVDGTIDADEAANYLGRVGINNGFYEKFALKAVTVEQGFQVTSPAGKQYFPGQPIWGASQYDDWEEFRSYVETGTSEWQIEPYDGPAPETSSGSLPKQDTPEAFSKALESQLGKAAKSPGGLDLAKIESVAEKFGAQIDALAQTDQQEAQKYKEIVDKILYDKLMEVVGKQKLEKAQELDKELSMEKQKGVKDAIKEYDATVKPELDAYKEELSFTIGSKSGVHLGGLLSAFSLSGSDKLMAGIVEKLQDAFRQYSESGNKTEVTVALEDLFPSKTNEKGEKVPGLTDEAKEVYRDILNELSTDTFKGGDEDVAKIVALAGRLAVLHKGDKEVERKQTLISGLTSTTKFEELKELLSTLAEKSGNPPEDYLDSAMRELEFASRAREIRQNMDSRNMEIQGVVDMCRREGGSLDATKLKEIFKVMDKYNNPLGGKSFSDILKKYSNKLEVDEEGLRLELASLIRTEGLTFREKVDGKKLKFNKTTLEKYREEMLSVLGSDYYQAFVNYAFRTNKNDKTPSLSKILEHNEHTQYVLSHRHNETNLRAFYKELAENIRYEYELHGNNPYKYNKNVIGRALSTTLDNMSEKLKIDRDKFPEFEMMNALDQKFRTNASGNYAAVITNYFGTGEHEGYAVIGKARQGIESLITFSFMRNIAIHREDPEIANSLHSANLMTLMLANSDIEFDPTIGSFTTSDEDGSLTGYIHANVLLRARFIDAVGKKADGSYGLIMDDESRKVFEQRIMERNGITEVTDKEIIHYLVTTDDFINPNLLMAANIRHSSVFGDILQPNEAERMRNNIGVDTTSRQIGLHTAVTTINGADTTDASTKNEIDSALDNPNISIASVAGSVQNGKTKRHRVEAGTIANDILNGDFSSAEKQLDEYTQTAIKDLIESGKGTLGDIKKKIEGSEEFKSKISSEYLKEIGFDGIKEKTMKILNSRFTNINDDARSALEGLLDSAFEAGRENMGYVGHSMEMIAMIPALYQHMQNQDVSNVEHVGDTENMSGVIKWTAGGKQYMFAKPTGTGGSIDAMVIEIENGNANIFPYEAKMESEEGKIPHIGSPRNYHAALATLWRDEGLDSISMKNIIALDMPHSDGEAKAYEPKLTMTPPEGESQEFFWAGLGATHGKISKTNGNFE